MVEMRDVAVTWVIGSQCNGDEGEDKGENIREKYRGAHGERNCGLD